jgi:hypothetical protein
MLSAGYRGTDELPFVILTAELTSEPWAVNEPVVLFHVKLLLAPNEPELLYWI